MISNIQADILKLKKEMGVTILAHSYQSQDITEIADFVGDSYQLSLKAKSDKNQTFIMCGVHFMAETVKILSPNKKVILAHPQAGCPMAEQIQPNFIVDFKKKNPDYAVVAYINTTAALKTVCDVCVTSATAVKICEKIENKNILFIPDCNLGAYVAEKLPQKNIKLVQGGCPVHASVTADEVIEAKNLHPNALVLCHPECTPAVLKQADFIGSTSAIMDFAEKSDKKDFIIGTEISIAEHLGFSCPEKNFHIMSKKLICQNMRICTLIDVYNALRGTGGLEILMDSETISKAYGCIDRMIELGK
ncbi:MAG: quinolinate synthase NadA [Oscillospiraceae bacterium]